MIQNLADVQYTTSDQQQEASNPRIATDGEDFNKVYSFLEEREPFRHDSPLVNIVTGVEAGAQVTAHTALSLGNCILNQIIGQDVYKYKFKRSMTVKAMDTVLISIKTKYYVTDSNLMFQRLLATVAIRRDNVNVEEAFCHELCTYPPRLFQSETFLLPADNKSNFTNSVKAVDDNSLQSWEEMKYVIDGGMLVQRVPWKLGSTFREICMSYVLFLSKYPTATIVLDGYEHSTKDMVHKKRKHHFNCSNIMPSLAGTLTIKKAHFLSNLGNKQRFVNLLQEFLENLGFVCLAARDDADVLICRTAADIYNNSQNVTLVGDDTDLLVLLVHMIKNNNSSRHKLFLSTKTCVYDIQSVKKQFGSRAVSKILLLHSFTGCDTTSRILGVGQDRLLKLEAKLDESVSSIFYDPDSAKEQIKVAGENIFALLLGLPMEQDTLDSARLKAFNTKVIKSSSVIECGTLPPTSAAAEQHSYRVYHQIQTWLENCLDATEWGWKVIHNQYVPVTSTLPAAPPELMNIIHCNCKGGCKNNQCTCRKNSLHCGPGCTSCTENCENRDNEEQ